MPIELTDPNPLREETCVTCGGTVLTRQGSIPRHSSTTECLDYIKQRLVEVETTMELLKKHTGFMPDTTKPN